MTENKPKAFKDLPVTELRRAAIEDFAVAVESTDNKTMVITALMEGGVEWADYVSMHPEVAPEPVVEPVPVVVETPNTTVRETEAERPGVTTNPNAAAESTLVVESAPKVHVAEPVVTQVPTTDKFLIKMVRENPLYEVRGHRFTSTHPYALVSPADAQYILSKEEGFRQALPNELAEFYG